ncbi:hypothetical protein DFH29DRAFT_874652 [Suillus ampliporus]|nr:hypothetical protein DFH29DRAFT_874652 [Suillus ampliporus]
MVAPPINIGIQTAKYCNVAGLGLLIFDYFLTLEQEVRWTWNRRWDVCRVIFVLSRYMPFAAAGMTSYGEHLPISPAIHIISIVAAEGLLIIRTHAFWKRSKKLLVVLLVLAVVSLACAVSITEVVNNISVPANPSDINRGFKDPPTSNCIFEAGRSSSIQYGFLIAYELFLMSLMVFKRYQDYRDCNGRLVNAVFQGGMLYMTAIILIMTAAPLSYNETMDVPQIVLHICAKVTSGI